MQKPLFYQKKNQNQKATGELFMWKQLDIIKTVNIQHNVYQLIG